MKMKWLNWLPLTATAVLMYLARITNLGVTDYNLFLIILMIWCLCLITFYRNTHKRRHGKTMDEVQAQNEE
jgi:uncharacterized protein (DUF486 family)